MTSVNSAVRREDLREEIEESEEEGEDGQVVPR